MADQSRAKSCPAAQAISLGVVALTTFLLFLFSLRDVSAATSMTLMRRESQPISEGQTIIRSHYLRERPVIAGVRLAPTTVTQEIIVVGCGVNYDANRGAGQPSWVPSQAALQPSTQAGVAFECTANPLEIRLPADSGHPLQLAKNGAQVSCRLVGARLVAAEKKDDQTVRYSNVFPDTDLEWKVGKGFLKEALIVRSRNAPAVFSFSLQADVATKLLVPDRSARPYGQRDLLASPTAAHERIRGSILISRDERSTRGLIRILPATVQDADGRTTHMITTVLCGPDRSLLYTIAIPKAFYSDPARKFPLIVDPTFINVPSEGIPLVYEAGKTYYIETCVDYVGGTVTVEANAILKFAPNSLLSFVRDGSNAINLHVQGTPYNYAIFTSGYDDSVGVDTDGAPDLPLTEERDPQPGDYVSAICYSTYDDNDFYPANDEIEINYAKFAYAFYGIELENDCRLEGNVAISVKDSIFRQYAYGFNFDRVEVSHAFVSTSFVNCLFVGSNWSSGVPTPIVVLNGIGRLEVQNCTFDGGDGYMAIRLTRDNSGLLPSYYLIRNNVFANFYMAVFFDGTYTDEMPDRIIDYNGLYHVAHYVVRDFPYPEGGSAHCVTSTQYPFEANANGSYYLKTDSVFRDYGWGTPQAAGLSGKATTAATDANGRIKRNDITQSQSWTRFEAALDNDVHVDLGYHYDPVDIIIDPIVDEQELDAKLEVQKTAGGEPTTLWINPGVVVAFSADTVRPGSGENVSNSTSLVIRDECNVDAQGTGHQPILFTSCAASGDRIGHPKNSGTYEWYRRAIQLGDALDGFPHVAGPQTRIRYCHFSWGGDGGLGTSWPHQNVLDINNCVFSYCYTGILAYATGYQPGFPEPRVVSRNNLFHHICDSGVTAWTAWDDMNSMVGVENCTFDDMMKGMSIICAHTKIRNCIFSNIYYTTQYGKPPYDLFTGDYAGHYVTTPQPDIANCYGDDSGETTPGFDPGGDPPVPNINERYYLNQTASPCIDAGDQTIAAYQTTARGLGLANHDRDPIDIGYHYPARGLLKVNPNNQFLQFEDGDFFYPIAASIGGGADSHPLQWNYSEEDPGSVTFWNQTVPDYLGVLANHGVNMVRIYPYRRSTILQKDHMGFIFDQNGVRNFSRFFDAMYSRGPLYGLVATYDGDAMSYISGQSDNSIYLDLNDGHVPKERRGKFFVEQSPRNDYQISLNQFLENTYSFNSILWRKWYLRPELQGWDLFSRIDLIEENYPWYDDEDPYPYGVPNKATWRLVDHENALATDWLPTMAGVSLPNMAGIESFGLAGRRRLHWVDVSNLARFKRWRADSLFQPGYLENANNDFIDYQLYTLADITENPTTILKPLQQYLGVPYLVTGSADNTAKVWSDRNVERVFSGHSAAVNCVACSPREDLVVSGGSNSKAYIWSLGDGTISNTLGDGALPPSHTGPVNSAAFSPDGEKVLTGSSDHTVKLWSKMPLNQQFPNSDIIATFNYESSVNSVAFSPDGLKVLAGGDGGVAQMWEYDTTNGTWPTNAAHTFNHGAVIRCVAFSPLGNQVLTAGDGGTYDELVLWNVTSGNADYWFDYGGSVNSAAFSPDGSKFVAGGYDGVARIWTTGGQPGMTFDHGAEIKSVAFSPGGERILTAGRVQGAPATGMVKLWKADGSDLVNIWQDAGVVNSVAFPSQHLFSWEASLPEIIDYYRNLSPRRGFFSSEFRLSFANMRRADGSLENSSKRFMNDCYHNYLWLGFASGSIGGPIPYYCPRPRPYQLYYDLSGVTFLNNDPDGWQLNCYTDEILDSMLSLSRFTSLVRWDKVTDDFRPMRATKQMTPPGRRVTLKTGYQGPEVSQNDWLWTAASDGKVTVGWIVRNYSYDDRDRWDSNVTSYVPTPWIWVEFTGLDASASDPLELVWFDDHRGRIVPGPITITASSYQAALPMILDGFEKSVAFLIQPAGDTPMKVFAELPDQPIGQILIDTITGTEQIDLPDVWNEELASLTARQGYYNFIASTKPAMSVAQQNSCWYRWTFQQLPSESPEVHEGVGSAGYNSWGKQFVNAGELWQVKLDIEYQGVRISGDMIHVEVGP